MSALSLALEILGADLTGGAFASVLARLGGLQAAAGGVSGAGMADLANNLLMIEGAAVGAGAAFLFFKTGLQSAVDGAAELQMAGTMASIAISDGSQHVSEIEQAIVQLANTSQYKIADVDMAFRVLGGLGFDTGQILGGMGQQAVILAQALGGPGAQISVADAARLLGQTLYIFSSQGLTAKQAADELTGAYYNNMMSVSDLNEFMGMAGGTAAALGGNLGDLLTFGSMLTPMFGSASSAGASLSYMMRNLAHPATSKMADEIRKLGLHVFDAQGNFVGLKSIMDQLFQDTAGMTEQQKMDVFGTLFNVRSGRAAMDMMSQTQSQFDAEYNRINARITQVGQAQKDSNAINDTAIGAWNRLITTIHDFWAIAGLALLPVLTNLDNALNTLFSDLQSNPAFEDFLSKLLPIGTALSAIALVALAVGAAIMLGLAGPIGIAIGVFVAIVGISADIAFVWHLLQSRANDLTGSLAFLNPLIDWARSAFAQMWKEIQQNWQQMQPLMPLLKLAAELIGALLAAMVVSGIIAFGLAIVGLIDFLSGIGAAIGNATHMFELFASVVIDIVTLLHDVMTGQWQKVAGDVANIQRDWNSTMQQLEEQQTAEAAKQQQQQAADAQANALKKEADQYNAVAAGDEKLRAQAQQQADFYDTEAKNTKDKTLQTQLEQQAAMFQSQADGYAQQRDAATQSANNLIAQANQVKANETAISQATMTAVTQNMKSMSSNTSSSAHEMANETGAYMNEMRSDALTQAQRMVSQVGGEMQSLAGIAATWGNDMANNFANGFNLGASSAETSATRFAAKMAATLGHSKPTEGPLVDDDVWGLHMAENFALGLLKGVGVVGNAAAQLAQAAVLSPTVPTGSLAYPTPAPLMGGGAGQQIVIPIYLDQTLLAEYGLNTVTGQLTMNGMGRQFR